jgi:hypothetical protein
LCNTLKKISPKFELKPISVYLKNRVLTPHLRQTDIEPAAYHTGFFNQDNDGPNAARTFSEIGNGVADNCISKKKTFVS